MKSLQQYSIPFTGLKPGIHQFEFGVDDSFFKEFEYSLVKSGKLKVDLDLEKQETMMILHAMVVFAHVERVVLECIKMKIVYKNRCLG